MAEYRVIHTFVDLSDKHYIYRSGDKFPRDGIVVNEDRIADLASGKNKIGKPVIEKITQVTEKIPYEKPEIVELDAVNIVGDLDDDVTKTGEESDLSEKPAEKKRGRRRKDAD